MATKNRNIQTQTNQKKKKKLFWSNNGINTEQSGHMDQGPKSQDTQGLVGSASMADEVAVTAVEHRRQGTSPETPARVRETKATAPRALPSC